MEKTFPQCGKLEARADLLPLLRAAGADLAALYARADAVRRERCGDAVPIRSIIEFSNVCANDCLYCGIRASNPVPTRYRMSPDEILTSARQIAASKTAGTIVLQGGETPGYSDDEIAALGVAPEQRIDEAMRVLRGRDIVDVHAVAGHQHEHDRRAVEDVAGGDEIATRFEEVGFGGCFTVG